VTMTQVEILAGMLLHCVGFMGLSRCDY